MIVKISTRLEAAPESVWRAAKSPATFLRVTRGLLGVATERRLPDRWEEGEVIRMRLLLFHVLPLWRHELRIVRVCERSREIYTNERGGPVTVWNHLIRVEPEEGGGCRYTDEVEVRAGLLTAPSWLLVQLFFRYRQMRWRALAGSLGDAAGGVTRR